jgi:hypothetical protein
MAEVVLGRYRPEPGTRAEDLEIPGPGLYEADFELPNWLLPDLDVERRFTFPLEGSKIEHVRTRVIGSTLTMRFRVVDEPRLTVQSPQTAGLFVALTVANVLRFVAASILGALAVKLIQAIVEGLREVRKLGETPAGIGLAALGVAGAIAIAVGTWKGG